MAEESKPIDPTKEESIPGPSKGKQPAAAESNDESGSDGEAPAHAEGANKKPKKKSKKKNIKQALTKALGRDPGLDQSEESLAYAEHKKAIDGLTPDQLAEFINLNPALAEELVTSDGTIPYESALEAFKQLKIQDIITGLASSGKNRKDMASYKFWATQPVPKFDDTPTIIEEEGPLKFQKVEDIATEPIPLALDQFRWVTMDLTNDQELEEVEKLLYGHYVEDDEAMFRFKYSKAFLRWLLMSPGWKKEWHIGIRVGPTLCAFISAVPVNIRVRNNTLPMPEVNFLCIHKKLRGKRLAPVLIKEVTRRVNLTGVWQAIYTGGIVLPRPVSTCRYFHRALNWTKLYECKFSPCPPNSKPQFQVRKYKVPDNTSTQGLRELQAKDLDAVHSLLERYLKRFDLAPVFSKEETQHYLLPDRSVTAGEQVVWSYVVEDPSGKITDFFSFSLLESSVIKSPKHQSIRAAYLFYYATETGLTTPLDKSALKTRLNELIADALILANRYNFDVMNAMSLMDNALFLEQQKFGPGDGQLHFYLFNYKAKPIHGGVDKNNRLDENNTSGIGFVQL
ncbi:Acyl-CoA N-acyltransferase [Rhypophila decipiens]